MKSPRKNGKEIEFKMNSRHRDLLKAKEKQREMEEKWVLFQGFRKFESAKADAEKENSKRVWRKKMERKMDKKDPQDGVFSILGAVFYLKFILPFVSKMFCPCLSDYLK